VHGSGGAGGNISYWEQQLTNSGIATFTLDYFTGRGVENTGTDQSKLGRLNSIYDIYRSLELLGSHKRIDPARIGVMGFSRGAQGALYASLKRFQKMHGPKDMTLAAHVAFYTPCGTEYLEDTDVSAKPIRLYHGLADDYVVVGPCRKYVDRLRGIGKDITLTEYPEAHHVFDNPLLKETPTKLSTAQTTRNCVLKEDKPGRVVNVKTNQPFTYADPCVELGPHAAYNRAALDG
jgi:dienelactone hydrolase